MILKIHANFCSGCWSSREWLGGNWSDSFSWSFHWDEDDCKSDCGDIDVFGGLSGWRI